MGGIQGLLAYWQCPAALAAVGICCELVKAVCPQISLIYPRVPARRSKKPADEGSARLARIVLSSPNPQMHFALFSTTAEALSQKLKLQGNISTAGRLRGGVSHWGLPRRQRDGKREQKKVLKGLRVMQRFGANACCSLSKGAEEAAAALLPETGGHKPSSEPHVRLLAGVRQHLCLV